MAFVIIKPFEEKTVEESAPGNLVFKCAPLGRELCKLWRGGCSCKALRVQEEEEGVQEEETKPNKFHLRVQNVGAGASAAAAAADLHP